MRLGAIALCIICLFQVTPSIAADFKCGSRYWDYSIESYNLTEHAGELDADGMSKLCRSVLISGVIVAGDAAKFQAWLTANPFTLYVYLRSPGGDIEAAMKIGRTIRSRFMHTQAEPHGTERGLYVLLEHEKKEDFPNEAAGKLSNCSEKGCCLSACVLILAAGASFEPGNIGLHRPSAKDFATSDYASVRDRLEKGLERVRGYLSEMEVSPRLQEAMMSVPSDELLMLGEEKALPLMTGMRYEPHHPASGVAPSIYEWAKPRCERETGPGIRSCIHSHIRAESIRLSKVRMGTTKR